MKIKEETKSNKKIIRKKYTKQKKIKEIKKWKKQEKK